MQAAFSSCGRFVHVIPRNELTGNPDEMDSVRSSLGLVCLDLRNVWKKVRQQDRVLVTAHNIPFENSGHHLKGAQRHQVLWTEGGMWMLTKKGVVHFGLQPVSEK